MQFSWKYNFYSLSTRSVVDILHIIQKSFQKVSLSISICYSNTVCTVALVLDLNGDELFQQSLGNAYPMKLFTGNWWNLESKIRTICLCKASSSYGWVGGQGGSGILLALIK